MKRFAVVALIAFMSVPILATNDIEFGYPSGSNLYAFARRASDGKVWSVAGSTWATWSASDINDYDITLTDRSGSYYSASFPSTSAGTYTVVVCLRSGSYPSASDLVLGSGEVIWTGTSARSLASAKLDTDGIDSITTTAPSGVPTTFREMMVMVYRRFYNKVAMTSTAVRTYGNDGTTVITTQATSDDGTTQTMGTSTH